MHRVPPSIKDGDISDMVGLLKVLIRILCFGVVDFYLQAKLLRFGEYRRLFRLLLPRVHLY